MDRLASINQGLGVNRVYKVYVRVANGSEYKGCHQSLWMAEKQKALLIKQGYHHVKIAEVITP